MWLAPQLNYSLKTLEQASRVLRFLLVCQTVPAQAEHLMVKGTYAKREAVKYQQLGRYALVKYVGLG